MNLKSILEARYEEAIFMMTILDYNFQNSFVIAFLFKFLYPTEV